jgi:glycosyltransferase involved in cell wall biosynthesis
MRLALVAILQDEEPLIARWVAGWRRPSLFDEVVVVDGGSKDGTVAALAREGLTAIVRPFPRDFAQQRNIALEHVTADWVFELDADEVPSKPLLSGLRTIAEQCTASGVDVVGIARLNFHDAQLRPGPGYRGLDYQYRLHARSARWSGAVHEVLHGTGGRIELDISDGHFIQHLKTEGRHLERNALYQGIAR